MNTTDAIRLLTEARQLQRDGVPTLASRAALLNILTTTTNGIPK